jgi:hypothetical protein
MITAKQSIHFAQLVQQFDNKQMQSYYEHLLSDEPVEDFFLKFAKYNPNHDSNGRFASGGGSGAGAGAPAGASAGGEIKPADPTNGYVTADEATLTEGTFDEKTQGDELAATYENKYNVDKNGNPIGTTKAEIDALDSYSRNGYKDINAELRGQNVRQELDVAEATQIIENDESMYLQAIDQWSEQSDSGKSMGDMSEADLQDAMYLYAANHGKELLDRINTGNTPKALAIKEQVAHLDGLIATAPVAFGDKPLYRVFDNKVLADLKPGDVVTDKGFLSTTRTNVIHEDNSSARTWLSGIDRTPDTAGIILPNKSKNGKGIAVDAFRTAVGKSNPVSEDEKEVLLPRSTPLRFLGYTNMGVEDRAPVFQRMDG